MLGPRSMWVTGGQCGVLGCCGAPKGTVLPPCHAGRSETSVLRGSWFHSIKGTRTNRNTSQRTIQEAEGLITASDVLPRRDCCYFGWKEKAGVGGKRERENTVERN